MKLEALFLDVGGTLLSERRPRPAIYADAARARGREVGDDRMLALMREAHRALPETLDGAYRYSDRWFEAFIGRIFRDGLGLAPAEVAEVVDELFARFEDPATFAVLPGARALIGDARAHGLKVGVISNWSARLPVLLARVGLAAELDPVLSSALEGHEKPDPRLFTLAAARAGVAPARALHAGDHVVKDGLGARGAGMEAVLVDRDGALALDPRAAGFPRVHGLDELRERILCRA